MLFENVEIKPPDIDLVATASQTLDSAREMAESTWTEFSQGDTVSETIKEARNMADDAWEATAPVVETVATAASEGARDTAYVAARAGLGVAKLGENAYKAVKTFGSKAMGDEEGAVETAQSSAIDDIAEDLGDKLDVSDEVKAVGDGAEVVGEVVGGIGVAVAAVALAPEGAATAVAVVGTDALFALDVSGEVLENAASDGEITNEETAIAAGAGAGTAALGAVAGKAATAIMKGIGSKIAAVGIETAGKDAVEAIDTTAAKEATEVVTETADKHAAETVVDAGAEAAAKDTAERAGQETSTAAAEQAVEKTGKEVLDDTGKLYRVGDDLVPNNEYIVNGYKYKTDELGRIETAEGKLHLKESGREKLSIKDSMENISKGSNESSDQRGHLIADMFDGGNGLENIVAMDGKLNQGAFNKLENRLASALRDGSDVTYKVEVRYADDAFRPNEFVVTDVIDGEVTETVFKNVVGGI